MPSPRICAWHLGTPQCTLSARMAPVTIAPISRVRDEVAYHLSLAGLAIATSAAGGPDTRTPPPPAFWGGAKHSAHHMSPRTRTPTD
eukprot:CAMPEP_0183363076 /NCGR_PEP_ID=MMETSP0164_2-20130417/73198_1 /TAXON_ID=221442 /ORGANISM="Coccolithus pelagicus ssp braarudi, Strain PLY182g" /LENGTH=86 /DNA_ID=CAMNT_0025538093 /DNA_START=92 /DNA_END=351 /DNA_ORIENTATION=+